MTAPDDAFDALSTAFLGRPGVTTGTGFGASAGLLVGGKIFAMLLGERLVVKLPAARCSEICAQGHAEPLASRPDRPYREWVVVGAERQGEWPALAEEAFAFVA